MNPAVISSQKGVRDTNAPSIVISTLANSPSDTVTPCTITVSKAVTGLADGDITKVNCTTSNFTQVSGSVYTVDVNAVGEGDYTVQIPAAKCVDNNGISNTASNTLELVYDTGSTYDLENATFQTQAEIRASHIRGHVASFCDISDLIAANNLASGEMFCLRENLGATMMSNSTSSVQNQIYKMGRVDFGILVNQLTGDFATQDPKVTTTRDGNPTTVGGFKNGVTTNANLLMPYMLSIRNSVNLGGYSYATGQTDLQMINVPSAIRPEWYSETTGADFYAGTWAEFVTLLTAIVADVISTGGWYRSFSHWPWFVGDYAPDYFALINTLIGANDVYRGTMNSIAEYYFVKEAIDSVTGNNKTVTITHSKKYPGSAYDRITTPAWIRVDLTGTLYEGGDIIAGGRKIRSMGNDVYYIACNLDFDSASTSFNILATTTPAYVNLNPPVLQRSGNTITSDQSVKIALYRKLKAENEIQVTLEERFLTPSTSFTLASTLNTSTYDYYVGAINDDLISSVLQF